MIEVSELTKRYGEHLAVDSLSFVVSCTCPVSPPRRTSTGR